METFISIDYYSKNTNKFYPLAEEVIKYKIIDTSDHKNLVDSTNSEFNTDKSMIESYYSDSADSADSADSETDSLSFDGNLSNYYFRRIRRKDRHRLIREFDFMSIYYSDKIIGTSEYTCDLNKDSPFIQNLILKRMDSCIMGPSSHIAAFLSNAIDVRSCFIPCGKGKGRNR